MNHEPSTVTGLPAHLEAACARDVLRDIPWHGSPLDVDHQRSREFMSTLLGLPARTDTTHAGVTPR